MAGKRKSSKRTHSEATSSSTQTVTTKEVIAPKVLDTQYFVNNGFDFIRVLKDVELNAFLEINKAVYPHLIREFYSNLNLEEEVLTSEVAGIEIQIDQTRWTELTSLPCDGLILIGERPSKEWVMSTKYDHVEAKASLLVDDSPLKATTVGYLHTEYRLLHYALVTGLLPRSSNHAYLLDKDVFPIWTMLNGITVNWGYCVMNHMVKAAKSKGGGLPYGMFLTKIFEHFDVPLNEQEKEDPQTYKMFGQSILSQMGIKSNIEVYYDVRQPAGVLHHEEELPEHEEEDYDSSAPPHLNAPPYMVAFMNEMRTRMDQQDQRLDGLAAQIGEIYKLLVAPQSQPTNLADAVNTPRHLKKKLLVLDVNGLLACITHSPPKNLKPDYFIRRQAILKRPFYVEFLKFCFVHFEVGIWTSRKQKNTEEVIEYLMPNMKNKLLFCWDGSYCTATHFMTLKNEKKPVVFKDLRKIWEHCDPNLPWEKGYFNESNTLLLDDSPYKALLNPPHNSVFPFTFDPCNKNDNALAIGGDLREYLHGLSNAENVPKYVEQHPFGQIPINHTHVSWEFYRKIIASIDKNVGGQLA